MTLYDILEVAPHASQREIKRAYRRLARRYHPDLNPEDPDSEERFKELASAYQLLSDRRKRAAYDERVRAPATAARPRGQERSEPSPAEWRDLGRDLRDWRSPLFDFRDAHLGALLSVSLTIASNASDETRPFLFALAVSLLSGLVASVPFRLCFGVDLELLRVGAGILAPFTASMGAMAGAGFASGSLPTLWGPSGIPYAFAGGVAGSLLGGMFGRSFRDLSGPASGVLVGGAAGALVGAVVGGFFWYWGTIFRWMEWPARDDLSVLASVGIVGAFLGAAFAAALAGAREPI